MNTDRLMDVLAAHYIRAHGMTYSTPDRCACGVEAYPQDGDEDVSVRRARAFAAHQTAMLIEHRKDA
jgi:hypothetical protein